ncbi:MAG: hypothetical protein WKF43_08525 [Acidimicrobiales bacterium]
MAVVPVEDKIRDGQAFLNDRRTFPMDVARLGPLDTIAFDIAPSRRSYAAVLQFWLDDTRIVAWAEGTRPPAPWVLAASDSPRVRARGGRRVFLDDRLGHALWVLPGPEQRRLSAQGRLLPGDLTGPLPASAQVGSVTLAPGVPTEPVALHRGQVARVPLQVRHRGVGAPWIDGASYRGRGSVRVGVRWYDEGEQVSFPFERADLRRTLWPDQAVALTFGLRALDDDGDPLPAGRYEAVVTVLQEGIGVMPGVEGLRLTVDVT